jgi:Putative porin
MKLKKLQIKIRKWASLAVFSASIACASAQSADALIDKLVDKGILTVKEANELREEVDKNFTQATSAKNGMPEWVTAIKFGGDVRARFENFSSDATIIGGGTTNGFQTRNRMRYRLRFGATVTMFDSLEAGFRLTSSDPAGGFTSGDPISGNTTFQDNASKKFIFVDQAYGRWYALNGPDWTGNVAIGKMENPFVFDEMVFDPDYTPEGGAIQVAYRLNDHHSLKLIAACFVLDENALSGADPYMLGSQVRWDATWNTKWSSTMGLAYMSIANKDMLTNGAVPNVNRGNFRQTPTGILQYHFDPIVADAAITYTAPSFPVYKGPFPIRIGGEYINNPSAPSSADNYAWNVGIMFGKSGKKGTWDISYVYRWLGANAWYEEFEDSDFGAFYGASPPSSGVAAPINSGTAYGAGTNVKGHVVRLAYSPTDAMTLSVKWFLTNPIQPFPSAPGLNDNLMSRVQVDASLKF